MVQPIVRSHSGQDHRTEDSPDVAVHQPLDDSGIQTDNWNSARDTRRTNRNTENHQFFLPEDDDLEGAVGYSPNYRAVPEWNNAHSERRQSYWGGHSGQMFENGSHRQRRHSSGELSRRHSSYENYIGHSQSNPGERRTSIQSGPQERRGSNQSGYGVTERFNNWNSPEVLNPNHNRFATRYVYPPGIPHETVILGSELYIRFLREEIQRLNLQEPEYLDPNYAHPTPLRNNNIINMGDHLRQVANEFAQSALRRRVQERAESVCLENLNFSSFSDLLFGLFQEGGITSERVVVLFFFCSDLAIRALRNRLRERFDFITYWSQRYIMEKFSVWVQEHGGWAAVLQQSVNHVYKCAIIGFCCVGIVAMFIYIRNNAR